MLGTHYEVETATVSVILVFLWQRQASEHDSIQTLKMRKKFGVQAGVAEMLAQECCKLV